MESFPECKACILGTAGRIAGLCKADDRLRGKVLREGAQVLDSLDQRLSPAELSHHVFMSAYQNLGHDDPFAAEKRNQNAAALELRAMLRGKIAQALDPLHMAVKLSVAGNIIDLGAQVSFDMMEGIQRAVEFDFTINDYADLRGQLGQTRHLLYILDNAGEIVFDALLLEVIERQFPVESITLVVRRRPMLNDVTIHDAKQLGLTERYDVIDSGSDVFGLPWAHASADFKRRFMAADTVIAKGMANFETLDNAPRDVFFILMAKCQPISRHLQVSHKDLILKHHKAMPSLG